jgi:CubicO group peptidase (beta-lactamase class C family)
LNGRSYSIHTASQDYEVAKNLFQQIQLSSPTTIEEIQVSFYHIDHVEDVQVESIPKVTQLALSALSSSTPVESSNAEMAAEIDGYLQDLVTKEDFRGSVLVIRGGEPLLHKGYGVANERGEEITEQTIFHIGSLTKSFTAAAIVLLEQEGKLKIDDPIKNYLPENLYSSKWDHITIHQLLNHTSGLPNFTEEFYSLTSLLTEEDPKDLTQKEALSLKLQRLVDWIKDLPVEPHVTKG